MGVAVSRISTAHGREQQIHKPRHNGPSSVFTCTGALGTPSLTGPSLESIYWVSLTIDLCEG